MRKFFLRARPSLLIKAVLLLCLPALLLPLQAYAHGVDVTEGETVHAEGHAPHGPQREGPADSVADPELEAVVGKIMDAKLRPLMRELRGLRETAGRPGITEILGGIGYIIGLAGLAAYFRYKRGGGHGPHE
jgi:hypothetical protein